MSEYLKKEQVIAFLKENPYKKGTLKPIEVSTMLERQTETKFGFAIYPLQPRATLARILFSLHTEFRAASESVRTTILREEVVELGKKVQLLNGRKHPKKKIQEALASPVPGRWDVLDQALAAIYDIQLIFANEQGKKLSFAPADLRTWDTGKRTLVLESNGAEAWEWEDESKTFSVGRFLEEMEEEGWRIEWPVAEGTMKEMEEGLEELNLSHVDGAGKKLKKDILAARLGRAQAVRALA